MRLVCLLSAIYMLGLAGCSGSDTASPIYNPQEDVVDLAVPPDVQPRLSPDELSEEVPLVFPDVEAQDLTPTLDISEVAADVAIEPGAPGYPCLDGADCLSGFCVQTPQGKQCTMNCIEECPWDWVCVQHQPSLPDEVFICAPLRMNLCKPCEKNSDCLTNGAETGDACIPYGPVGDFCGASCMGMGDCPGGYECKLVLDIWGYESNQCILTTGECPCQPWFVDEGAKTGCTDSNDFGECPGERFCTIDGLTPCSAQEPFKEACNGKDDDCDGEIDEGAGGETCFVENQWGACKGLYKCAGGQLDCDADEPGAETCDGKDNDCDAQVDEGFPDSDLDGLADCLENDVDGDGVLDVDDNCPKIKNPEQADNDLDMAGDACDPDDDNDQVADALDCAPLDKKVHPEAEEICNGIDDDCNSMVDEGFADTDWDGLKDCVDFDDDNDGFDDGEDCAPQKAAIFPGAQEICDGLDNDCDFGIDEGFQDLDQDGLSDCIDEDIDGDKWDNGEDNCPAVDNKTQADQDLDGVGDACDPDMDGDGIAQLLDNCPELFNPAQKDLDDDGIGDACDPDLDGDGVADEDDNCPMTKNEDQEDADDDGVGDACDNDADGDGQPDETDCAPYNPYIFNGAPEECDGLDNNCNGIPDEGFPDSDFDGLKNCVDPDDDDDGDSDATDCQPQNPAIFTGAAELCNGQDDDCDDSVDEDTGSLACGKGQCFHTVPACTAGIQQECDPVEGQAPEVCDGLDNDCDGAVDEDLGWSTCGTGACFHMEESCVDGKQNACDPLLGAQKEKCDGQDNDCDGQVDEELGTTSCGLGLCAHEVADCINGVPKVCDPFAGKTDELCDGVDNSCDGVVDEGYDDFDQDGKADCVDPDDDADGDPDATDCGPLNAAINHLADEVCDGVDNNCAAGIDEEDSQGCVQYYFDADGDGHGTDTGKCLCGATGLFKAVVADDCNDLNPWIFPGATELCDQVDNNCNDVTDEDGATGCSWFFGDSDGDGYGSGQPACVCSAPGQGWSVLSGDCVEDDSQIHPGALELCDEVDNDCDDEVDETYNLDTDVDNCGQCGVVCQPDQAFGMCVDKKCQVEDCVQGWADCNKTADDGCEIHTDQDVDNCGACTNKCNLPHATAKCANGLCAIEQCDEHYSDTDGLPATGCETNSYGQSADKPGVTCKNIKSVVPEAQDGPYWIDIDGAGGKAPFQVFCEMTTEGGGWTFVLHYNQDYGPHTGPLINDVGSYKLDRGDGEDTYSVGILDEIDDSEMMITLDSPDPATASAAHKFVIFKYDAGNPSGFNQGPLPCSGSFSGFKIKMAIGGAWVDGAGGACNDNHWFPDYQGVHTIGCHSGNYGGYWGAAIGGDNSHYHDAWFYVR